MSVECTMQRVGEPKMCDDVQSEVEWCGGNRGPSSLTKPPLRD